MNLVSAAIKRPVLFTMLILAIVLMGGLSYMGMPSNNMPELDIPYVTITTIYPGASPEEIETNVVKKIEDQVSTINGLKNISSTALENYTYTVLEFEVNVDADIANQEVKDKIELIKAELPSDAEEPVVQKVDIGSDAIVNLAFTSPMNTKDAYDYVDKVISERLTRIQGVSEVEILGGQEREIKVVLRKNDLSKYMLSPLQVMDAIGKSNMSLPSGNIDPVGYDFTVKVNGEISDLEELRNMEIMTPFGTKKLKDFADVIDDVKKIETIATYRDTKQDNHIAQNSINLGVKKLSDGNTVSIAKAIIAEVGEINSELPPGTTLHIASDQSEFIENSVSDTLNTIFLGIILTGLILYLFMHNLKNTFIIAVTMPVTLIGTFVIIGGMGFTLNNMTLMALSTSVGTLVSNSVVILENINMLLQKGHSVDKAAEKGTTEMVDAVIAATLTNVVVFLPIAMMKGIIGKMFVEFGITVSVIMLFTIFIAFTLTPMMAAKMLNGKTLDDSSHASREKRKKSWGYKFDIMFEIISRKYAKLLGFILSKKSLSAGLVVLAFFAFFAVVSVVLPRIASEFTTSVDEGNITISVEFPTHYNIYRTEKAIKQIEQLISELPETENIKTNIGVLDRVKSVNGATIEVLLTSATERTITDHDILNIINEKLSVIPDAKIKASSVSRMGGTMGAPIQIEILGDNQDDMVFCATKLLNILKKQKGAINVDTDLREGKPQIEIIPDKEKLAFYGLDAYTLSLSVRSNIEGLQASKFNEDGEEYDITVVMDDKSVNDPEQVRNIMIPTQKGEIRISSVAEVKYSKSPAKITRKNKQRMITVSGYTAGTSPVEVINATLAEFNKNYKIPSGITVQKGGSADMQAESFAELSKALIIALILTYMLIAGLLESFLQAVIILVSFPLSLIGVIIALYITGASMSIVSMMAIIMLLGIVVNNAILILDHTNALMKKGIDYRKAITKAGQLKLRAIAMSTIAIMLGMLPLALGLGEGGEFRMPMGIVSIGGLIASTVLTLFIIPSAFSVSMAVKMKISSLLFGERK